MKNNQKGFAHLGLIFIILVVLGAIGFAGYRVMDTKKTVKNNVDNTVSQSKKNVNKPTQETVAYNALKLSNEKVLFEIPKTWIVSKSNCIHTPGAAPICKDGVTLVPAEKMPTIYGGGTEYFTIYAHVYDNNDDKIAQRWFEDVYEGGSSSSSDKVSSESINGYSTYYFRQINNSYDEITYVYSASGKAVLLSARVSEKGYAPDGSGKVIASSDFTRYIPEIEKMAKSIKIN